MKATIAPVSLALGLLLPGLAVAWQAQAPRTSGLFGRTPAAAKPAAPTPTPPPAARPAAPAAKAAGSATNPEPAKTDAQVFKSGSVLPEPAKFEDLGPAQIVLPTEPIEPYLLTKEAGPFMVLAHSFRGPDATRYALALVLELRRDFGLPAWIYQEKVQPLHSNLRNVPPTANDYVRQPQLTEPERTRIYDEALVLVGNCKTTDESEDLLRKVKHLHPKCIDGMPQMLPWRKGKGLSRALRVTNPYVPAQYLFPRKADPLITQMNAGPQSLFNCPGRYTVQVGEFSGRSTIAGRETRMVDDKGLKSSPLMSAAEDAQKMADALAADPEVTRTGYRPYVYHDRSSSKVTVGSFDSPNDPAAVALRQALDNPAVHTRIAAKAGYPLVINPNLMDLQELPAH